MGYIVVIFWKLEFGKYEKKCILLGDLYDFFFWILFGSKRGNFGVILKFGVIFGYFLKVGIWKGLSMGWSG